MPAGISRILRRLGVEVAVLRGGPQGAACTTSDGEPQLWSSSSALGALRLKDAGPWVGFLAAGFTLTAELDLQLSAPDRPATPLTSERSLPGHLQGDLEIVGGEAGERDGALDDDYALNEALNVLKGLHLARERSGTQPKG